MPPTRLDRSPLPRVSIVTPSYNQGQFIEESIRSVLLQGYPDLEYIVIDGASTDGTVDILKRYDRWIDYWRSEPDGGQVDAILKGLDGASSDYFTWLNSDDLFEPGALSILNRARSGAAIAGKVTDFDDAGVVTVRQNQLLSIEELSKKNAASVFHQPGVFWPNTEPLRNSLDRSFHYAFDMKLLIWHLALNGPVQCVDYPVARFRLHDASKSVSQTLKFRLEMVDIVDELIHSAALDLDAPILRNLIEKRWTILLAAGMEGSLPRPLSAILRQAFFHPSRWTWETAGALKHILLRPPGKFQKVQAVKELVGGRS